MSTKDKSMTDVFEDAYDEDPLYNYEQGSAPIPAQMDQNPRSTSGRRSHAVDSFKSIDDEDQREWPTTHHEKIQHDIHDSNYHANGNYESRFEPKLSSSHANFEQYLSPKEIEEYNANLNARAQSYAYETENRHRRLIAEPEEMARELRGLKSKLDSILRKSQIQSETFKRSSPYKSYISSPPPEASYRGYENDSNSYYGTRPFKSTDMIAVKDNYYLNEEVKKRISSPIVTSAYLEKSSYNNTKEIRPQIFYSPIDHNFNTTVSGNYSSRNLSHNAYSRDFRADTDTKKWTSPVKTDSLRFSDPKNNEMKLNQIIEDIKFRKAGIYSSKVYDSKLITSDNTQYRGQRGDSFISPSRMGSNPLQYSSYPYGENNGNYDAPMHRDPSIVSGTTSENRQSYNSVYITNGLNSHVPLKLKKDRNMRLEQREKSISIRDKNDLAQRYYTPDPTLKEKDKKDEASVKLLQSQPLVYEAISHFSKANRVDYSQNRYKDQAHQEEDYLAKQRKDQGNVSNTGLNHRSDQEEHFEDANYYCQDLVNDDESFRENSFLHDHKKEERSHSNRPEQIEVFQGETHIGKSVENKKLQPPKRLEKGIEGEFISNKSARNSTEPPVAEITHNPDQKISQQVPKATTPTQINGKLVADRFFDKDSELDDFAFE